MIYEEAVYYLPDTGWIFDNTPFTGVPIKEAMMSEGMMLLIDHLKKRIEANGGKVILTNDPELLKTWPKRIIS